MNVYKALRKKIGNWVYERKMTDSETAYNIWASTYDNQPENLIFHLDEEAFDSLTAHTDFEGKTVIDYGCGTGRHWEKIFARKPAMLTGYDISAEMLERLQQKYPQAATHCIHDNKLAGQEDNSCDVIISTLVTAHVKDLRALLTEWDRVLKNNGTVILSDFHPDALESGATRCFGHNGKLVVIKNYIHTLGDIRTLAHELGWEEVNLIEKGVDESVKSFYRTPDALQVFENTYGSKLLYAFQFRKTGSPIS